MLFRWGAFNFQMIPPISVQAQGPLGLLAVLLKEFMLQMLAVFVSKRKLIDAGICIKQDFLSMRSLELSSDPSPRVAGGFRSFYEEEIML